MKFAIEVPVTKMPLALSGKPKSSRRPARDLALDFDRRVVAAAAIGIHARGQHLGERADGGAAALHPAHETGMRVAGGIRLDAFLEIAIDRVERRRLCRQGFVEARPHLVRQLRPDRSLAQPRHLIEHVVEHAMPERAQLAPIFGIKRRARFRSARIAHATESFFADGRPAQSFSIAVKSAKSLRICATLYG